MDGREDPDRQALIQLLTTEHFTLQGARAAAVGETNSRLQIYMMFVSMSVLALALVAQVSQLGKAFFAFAYILLPIAYLFGVATLGRLRQTWLEWFTAMQGMNRIRRFFVEVAPDAERYLIMPTSDEPFTTLRGGSLTRFGRLQGLYTAFFVIALVDSVIAGVFAGLLTIRLSGLGLLSAALGVVALSVSMVSLMAFSRRFVFATLRGAEVRFPQDGPN